MITIRIGKKMYDVVTKCPECGATRVSLSRHGDIIKCTFCEKRVYIPEAVGTPWIRESEVRNDQL